MVFWPSGLLVIQSSGLLAIRSSGHPFFRPSDHLAIRPSGHLVIQTSGHLIIWPSGYPVIRPSGHPVFWPSVPMPQKCPYWDIFGLHYCRLHQSQIPNVLPACSIVLCSSTYTVLANNQYLTLAWSCTWAEVGKKCIKEIPSCFCKQVDNPQLLY